MIKEKDLNALKERVNNIDPGQTEAIVQFIATPDDMEIMTLGRAREVSLILRAIAAAVLKALESSKPGATEHETTTP